MAIGAAVASVAVAAGSAYSQKKQADKAADAQEAQYQSSVDAQQAAINQARGDIGKLFPAAQQNLQSGAQGALDVLGQALPAQMQAFQGGNVAAQNQINTGMQQAQNAILGAPVDYSQFQAYQAPAQDLSFLQQQLPQYIDPYAPPTNQDMGVGGVLPANEPFTGALLNTGVNQQGANFNNMLGQAPFGGLSKTNNFNLLGRV